MPRKSLRCVIGITEEDREEESEERKREEGGVWKRVYEWMHGRKEIFERLNIFNCHKIVQMKYKY